MQAKAALEENLPFGWNNLNGLQLHAKDARSKFFLVLSKITGLTATILAIMLGAPFWFDLLNKITNLRGTGNKPVSSTGSSDK